MATVVKAACAVIKDSAGKIRYYYRGARLPEDLPKGEIKRLTDEGLLATVKETPVRQAGKSVPVKDAATSEPAKAETGKSEPAKAADDKPGS